MSQVVVSPRTFLKMVGPRQYALPGKTPKKEKGEEEEEYDDEEVVEDGSEEEEEEEEDSEDEGKWCSELSAAFEREVRVAPPVVVKKQSADQQTPKYVKTYAETPTTQTRRACDEEEWTPSSTCSSRNSE